MSFNRPAINPLDYTHDYTKNKGGYRLAAVYGSDSEDPKNSSRRLYYLDANDNEVELQSVDTSGPENIYYVEIENGVAISSANGQSFPIEPFIKLENENEDISYALYQLDPVKKIIGSQLPSSFVSPAKYISKLSVSIDNVIGLDDELKRKVSFFDTLDQAINDNDALKIFNGSALNIGEYSTGNGGGAMWDVVPTSSVTPNGANIVQSIAIQTLSLKLRNDKGYVADQYGVVFDGSTDNTAKLQVAINDANLNESPLVLSSGQCLTSDISGLSYVVANNCEIIYTGNSSSCDIYSSGKLTITGKIVNTQASSVSVSGENLTITTSSPVSGDYIMITESSDDTLQGLYQVLSVSGNSVTVAGANSKNTNGTITANVISFLSKMTGIKISGVVNLNDLLVDSDGSYGIQIGGGISSEPSRPTGESDIKNVGVCNASYLGLSVANTSSCGVEYVGFYGCKYSCISFSSSTVIGRDLYSNKSENAGFRCESNSHMYIDGYFCASGGSEGGLSSRYSSMLEMSGGFIADCGLVGSIAQFSSYQSIRDTQIYNTNNYGLYSTDDSSTVGNNLIIRDSGVNSLRIIEGSSFLGLNTIDITGDTEPYIVGSTRVEYNGDLFTGGNTSINRDIGDIDANLRFAFTVSIPDLLIRNKPKITAVLYSDLPNGVIFSLALISDGIIRYYLTNTTSSQVNVSEIDFVIHY